MSAARVLFAVALATVLLISPAHAQDYEEIFVTIRLALKGGCAEE